MRTAAQQRVRRRSADELEERVGLSDEPGEAEPSAGWRVGAELKCGDRTAAGTEIKHQTYFVTAAQLAQTRRDGPDYL